jgi:MYXO-CTERM domain-containing protein
MARWSYLGLATAFSIGVLAPSAKAASLSQCGDINVQASATCKVESGITCEGNCTPISCSGALYAQCQGSCNVTPPSCDVSCSGTCEGKCSANANFDCTADCKGTCSGSCDSKCTAHCASDADQTTCKANCNASCTATCQGECDASCSGNASATCQGKCSASCQGSCNASARVDCQATCQAQGYLDCEGGCKVACERSGSGGLFCDGQYVDDNGNLDGCISALQQALNIKVDTSGSASCSGNSCQAEGKASASCALSRVGENKGLAGSMLMLAAAGLAIGVRRRQRK